MNTLIAAYFFIGFIYAVILRAQDVINKNESFLVILFWPAHLIVKVFVVLFDLIRNMVCWISINSTVDFIAKRVPFSKLKD